MSERTVLIAHRTAAVRDRFAVALADARHASISADSEAAALDAVANARVPLHLALVDLGLSREPLPFVRALRERAAAPLAVMVFSGTVPSAAEIPPLAAMQVGYINEYASTPQIVPAIAPHLFPDNFNRRRSPRVTIGIPITYRTDETLAGAVTLNIGKGGVAIRTMTPLPRGATALVKFRLPASAAEIEATARVAWSDRKVGMGVQFDGLSSSHQRTIDAFVDRAIPDGA
ncbi:MAG TPA: PilZ domain-containing protein [Vicinamibacterales bacterium]|nr:PilZ domain-containing protein [Vicinamibacterales bacterium]